MSELISYFKDEYPKDKNKLNDINKNIPSKGSISKAFYDLVIEGCESDKLLNSNKPKNSKEDNFKFLRILILIIITLMLYHLLISKTLLE